MIYIYNANKQRTTTANAESPLASLVKGEEWMQRRWQVGGVAAMPFTGARQSSESATSIRWCPLSLSSSSLLARRSRVKLPSVYNACVNHIQCVVHPPLRRLCRPGFRRRRSLSFENGQKERGEREEEMGTSSDARVCRCARITRPSHTPPHLPLAVSLSLSLRCRFLLHALQRHAHTWTDPTDTGRTPSHPYRVADMCACVAICGGKGVREGVGGVGHTTAAHKAETANTKKSEEEKSSNDLPRSRACRDQRRHIHTVVERRRGTEASQSSERIYPLSSPSTPRAACRNPGRGPA